MQHRKFQFQCQNLMHKQVSPRAQRDSHMQSCSPRDTNEVFILLVDMPPHLTSTTSPTSY